MSAGATDGRRGYESPHRRRQADETRQTVLAVATRLFGEGGWAATSMRDVAREAGVAVETVYTGFGSKSNLLMAAIDMAVVGDDDAIPVRERDAFTALGQGGRDERLRSAVRLVTAINQRTVGVNLALREAAASNPELDRLMREREGNRRSDVQAGVSLVVGRQLSRDVYDGLWALLDVGVYRMLTDVRGWSQEQYEDWLVHVIGRLIDGAPADS